MADSRFKIKNGLIVEAGPSEVTGSLNAPNITGSLFGTASWALNAVSASYFSGSISNAVTAETASFVTASNVYGPFGSNSVLSSSYALTASYVKQAESASFALTSSYAVNMVISGGLTNVDYIDFDTASAAALQDARLKWDDGEGTLQLGLKGNVDANIGEQLYQYVYNAEATTLTKATVVYVSGSQGGRIAVKRASATAEGVSAETLGLAAEDIAAGAEGWVITDGSLRGVNTAGLIGGQLIFLSSSAGEYTQIYPQAPLHGVRLGYVQKVDANPNQGILYIKIDNGYELDELHDVRITSASTGELLVRSGSLWINTRQLTGSYGLTGSLTATTVNASFFTASGNAYPTNSGVSEYFLQTNGAGTLSWNYVRSVLESVKNVGATTLVKGTPVYVTSSVGNTAEVVKADAASSSLMPATYILNETLTAGQQGLGIVLGFVNNIDTLGFEESDEVYVAVGGGYTNVQPTGSALIQPLGTVVRVDNINGSIMVSNTGVTNSLPNINPGYAWVGDSNWLPKAIATSSFFVNSASFALTASSGDAFTVRRYLELQPGLDPGTANVSASYLFVTSSSDNTEFNLHYRNNGALWETHWLEERVDTGIVWGGVLTFTSTTMSITPGAGLIVNHNASTSSHGDTVATYVPFGPITASATFITSSQVTYLLIDENGQLIQQTTQFTPEQYNEKFPLGYIFCLTTSSISSYADARVTTYGQTEQDAQFIRAFGPLKLSGYDITAQSSSLKISIASGQSYRYGGFYTQNPESPSIYDSTAVPTGSLVRVYRDPGVTGGFRAATNGGFPFTDIDPTKWDDGSGTLQTVSASQWSIQRVFQGVVNNISYVYYGQNVYDSLALALQSITTDQFVESPTSILALPFIGYVIAKGDTTNLGDTSNNRIIQAGLFRNTAGSSGGGGAAAQNLNDLGDVTITSPVNGQALVYNSGFWVNGTPTSASFASTASYVLQAVSSSFATTASYVLQAVSASFASTASFVTLAQTASFVATASWANNAITASYVKNAESASYILNAVSSSFSSTASYVLNAVSSSFAQNSATASYVQTAQTASFVATASWAQNAVTASFVTTAQTASYVLQAVSASFATNAATASFVSTASWANNAVTASYVKNAESASYVLNAVSSSFATTASYVLNAVSSSFASTASYVALAQTASYVQNAQTASYVVLAQTASFVAIAQTASYVQTAQTASYVLNAVSSSFATTASYVLNAVSSSFATNAATASFVTLAQTASYVQTAQTASYVQIAETASFVTLAQTASYVVLAQTASFVATASWANNSITASYVKNAESASYVLNAVSASFATNAATASFVTLAQSASYVLQAVSASFATNADTASFVATASWANNAITASYVVLAQTASFVTLAQTASFVTLAQTASFVATASWANNAVTASYVTGSVFTSANPALSASYALSSSFAVSASWAPGGSGGLVTKAGSVANTSFAGNPRKATVTFGTAFANTSYAIVITGEDSRTWTIESKVAGSFVINANSNVGLAGTTYWIATAYGETS